VKYTQEITKKLLKDYVELQIPVEVIAEELKVQKRSVIAKLSDLGVYKRAPYLDKTGKKPIRKSEYIASIALTLNCSVDELDSLEKVNKRILEILDKRLKEPKP